MGFLTCSSTTSIHCSHAPLLSVFLCLSKAFSIMPAGLHELLDFDLDRYIDPWVPPSQLKRLPRPLSRWLGYRASPQDEPPALIRHFWSFIGAFSGLLVVGAIYKYAPGVAHLKPPVLVASLGASAILDYNAIRSPLSQPRNALLGQTFSAIIGVAVSKLFQLSNEFADLQWVAGALACAVATVVMGATNTVHPPGGATAVLACIQADIIAMSWWFVPVVLLASCAMLGVALLTNNIMRQYPVYWWTSADVGKRLLPRDNEKETGPDEKQAGPDFDLESQRYSFPAVLVTFVVLTLTLNSDQTLRESRAESIEHGAAVIEILPLHSKVPAWMELTEAEHVVLKSLEMRLARHSGAS